MPGSNCDGYSRFEIATILVNNDDKAYQMSWKKVERVIIATFEYLKMIELLWLLEHPV